MKIFLTRVFVTLGIIFLLLIVAGIIFIITDPYNLKPLLFGTSVSSPLVTEEETASSDQPSTSSGTVLLELSPEQKEAVTAVGINPEDIPTTMSTELEDCFASILGESRVAEIRAGAVPSALEFARARECVQ